MRRSRRSKELYFDWLVDLVDGSDVYDICRVMDEVEFFCVDPMDEARNYDGLKLRDEYEYQTNLEISGKRDQDRCSFFEFLVGFSIKIENEIMYNRDQGDRVPVWFHMMVENILNNVQKSGMWDHLKDTLFDVMTKLVPLFELGPTFVPVKSTYWMAANAYFIRVSE